MEKFFSLLLFFICTIVLTSGLHAQESRIPSRFFKLHNTWYEKIPTAPSINPRSQEIMDYLNSFTASLGVSYSSFSHPIFYARSDTPMVKVGGSSPAAVALGWDNVPIPDEARPAGYGLSGYHDGHLVVISAERKYAWEMYQANRISSTQWTAAALRRWDLDSDGMSTPYDFLGAVRLCPAPLLHGLVTYEEMQRGYIDHAMAVTAHTQANPYWAPYPGEKSVGGSDQVRPDSGIVACMRIQLDPSVNIDSLNLSPGGKVVAKALQEYGMIVTDGASKIDFDIYFESVDFRSDKVRWGGQLPDLSNIPKDKLRIVDSPLPPFIGYESEYNPTRVMAKEEIDLIEWNPFDFDHTRGTVPAGTMGTVLGKPVTAGGIEWWFVEFDPASGHDHTWARASQLMLVSGKPYNIQVPNPPSSLVIEVSERAGGTGSP
jgi:hypothetical protein